MITDLVLIKIIKTTHVDVNPKIAAVTLLERDRDGEYKKEKNVFN
tara:strand:- start:482 stop:616 length:135 start_codon:yes stop_codon:yes gene_type:complete